MFIVLILLCNFFQMTRLKIYKESAFKKSLVVVNDQFKCDSTISIKRFPGIYVVIVSLCLSTTYVTC